MLITIISFLAVLSVLVIAHEFGHYWTAKKSGMKVYEFGLGFPPKIFGWTDKNGTEWTFNLIPLGGFVRIKGENGDDPSANDADSFSAKSKIARFIVLIGGVSMNIIVAFILLTLVYAGMSGKVTLEPADLVPKFLQISEPQVSFIGFDERFSNAELNIPKEATLQSIDGIDISSASEVREKLLFSAENNESVEIVVSSNGELMNYTLSPELIEGQDLPKFGISIADVVETKIPFWYVPIMAFISTFSYLWLIIAGFFGLIRDIFIGVGVQEAVAGPIGIAKITGEIAQSGLSNLLHFAAILSLNLAVLNALPFPALDGGRILFVLIEAIRGKKNSPQIEAMVHASGFALLMILIVIITYRDIVNLL
jgi:regulator of sigma E protease